MRMIRYYLPAMGWIILILFLCTMPGSSLPSSSLFDQLHVDKIVHFFLFGGTVILLAYGYYRQRQGISGWALLAIALVAGLYGLIIEFIQKYFTVNRSFEIMDVAADTAGALMGALIFQVIGKRVLKK
ncbi:VanZ family protein [Chitinophaga sp. XS-30]|uniref:VanZ family protein n=1 Tax=Chitinophaga sp. XS-30 TaxID=2604421 RepID=UPI00143CEB45|nr:VanZ family protein [Chitinophaga sp. XS-30]